MGIVIKRSVPPEMVPVLRRHLKGLERLVPSWCHNVYIDFMTESNPEGATCTVRGLYDYRSASINVYAEWLDCKDADKQRALRHEFIHISLWPLTELMSRMCDGYLGDGVADKIVRSEFVQRMEMVVQDLESLNAVSK